MLAWATRPVSRLTLIADRQRISRRVIAEQHLALTETFHSPWHFPASTHSHATYGDLVGEVFLRCNAREVVARCAETTQRLVRQVYGSAIPIPQVNLAGHLEATFPYILSHLEYIVGELLRNSIQAIVERRRGGRDEPPPIDVLVCEAPQHVIIRVSDQGGGIPAEILPHIWSFSKGPRSQARLANLIKVPQMAATLQEMSSASVDRLDPTSTGSEAAQESSLRSFTHRPPDLKLGMGLPMSRVYAEYWAGSLELHSLDGYGTDAYLQISKLGNKNEQVSTRASIDGV